MLKRLFLCVIGCVAGFCLRAQKDSVVKDETFKMKEGIYLTYDDFRNNSPITRENIETNIPKDHLELFGKVLQQDEFSYTVEGEKITKKSKNAWGFFQNNSLHLNYNGDFYRVPLFGSISYLVANVEVPASAFYTPGYGTMGTTTNTYETREFLMNFYDGKLEFFSMEGLEDLFKRDPALYSEFKNLSRKKRKEQLTKYIRKYNTLHPVYFFKAN